MKEIVAQLSGLASNSILFYILQAFLVALFIIALINENLAKYCAGKGGAALTVERGRESMATFYGAYLAVNGVLIAICLSVEVVKGHRIFWVVVDTLIPAYLCVFNPWSRNKLIGWAHVLRKVEAR